MTRLATGRDVREQGSGNIGAANVARSAGKGAGAVVAVLDALKGTAAVLLGMVLGLTPPGLAILGFVAVLGHDFSLFLRFRGGKGVATTLGVALGLSPISCVLAAATFVIVLLVTGYSSLASLLALALLPIFLLIAHQPPVLLATAVTLFVLALLKHWENLVRLAQGKERSFRQRPSPDEA